MNATAFRQSFEQAVKLLFELSQRYCYNNLSPHLQFLIQPSGLEFHDGMNAVEVERLKVLKKKLKSHLTAEQILQLLHHDNKVPLWINMTVYESTQTATTIHLLFSRRLRGEKELFHGAVEYPPFNVLVLMPPESLTKKIGGRFDINWKRDLDKKQNPETIWHRLKNFFRAAD